MFAFQRVRQKSDGDARKKIINQVLQPNVQVVEQK